MAILILVFGAICYIGKYSLRDKDCDRDRHKHIWERRWDRLSEREIGRSKKIATAWAGKRREGGGGEKGGAYKRETR